MIKKTIGLIVTLIGEYITITVGSFEDEIALLRKTCEHGFYEYISPLDSFRTCTTWHFRGVRRQEKYGVYIVRQKDTQEVLYIGKGGTIDSQEQFKDQDIPERLKNVKVDSVSANEWFRNLIQEKGPLAIEYIFLSSSLSPAFVEASLLQAYLNQHHRLPYKNKSL